MGDSQTVVHNNATQPRDNKRGEGSKPKSQHAKQNKGNIICRYYQTTGGKRTVPIRGDSSIQQTIYVLLLIACFIGRENGRSPFLVI
jgi:hypothetical protein